MAGGGWGEGGEGAADGQGRGGWSGGWGGGGRLIDGGVVRDVGRADGVEGGARGGWVGGALRLCEARDDGWISDGSRMNLG